MKKTYVLLINILLSVFVLSLTSANGQAQSGEIIVTAPISIGLTPPIPISIEGISGEGLDVSKFDLYVQGFSFVPAAQAQYHISGSDNGSVVGRVSLSGKELFARRLCGRKRAPRSPYFCR